MKDYYTRETKHMTGEIVAYWTQRAESYSELNRKELERSDRAIWLQAMERFFPDRPKEDIRILDIGTGPGFFSILLAENGYRPIAADCTAQMLEEAQQNAGSLKDRISFLQMDADTLSVPDNSLDVIISRNLTWNLEDPCVCYTEWLRALRPGGRIIIFDANWYRYLYDEENRRQYDQDRVNVANTQLHDFNIGQNFDVMERIAGELPMSKKVRPMWDEMRLREIGYTDVSINEDIWEEVWNEEEKINFKATPMFRIVAEK